MTQTLRLRLGDSIEVLNDMEEGTLGGIVCDPPYGLEFMGKDWDTFKTGRSSKYAEGGSLPTFEERMERAGKGGSAVASSAASKPGPGLPASATSPSGRWTRRRPERSRRGPPCG